MRGEQKIAVIVYMKPSSKARLRARAEAGGKPVSQICVDLMNDGLAYRKSKAAS